MQLKFEKNLAISKLCAFFFSELYFVILCYLLFICYICYIIYYIIKFYFVIFGAL